MAELQKFGVKKPEILLSSDPALVLTPAPEEDAAAYLQNHGLDPNGKYLCLMLRTWYGFSDKTAAIAACADHAYQAYGLTPVFLSLNIFHDTEAARQVTAHMKAPYHILDDSAEPELLIAALSHMSVVVSMRLHGLIFSSLSGVPLVGVSYDPKIGSFLHYLGAGRCIGLKDVTAENLTAAVDEAVAQIPRREELRQKALRLQAVQEENLRAVERLLKK